MIELDIEGVHTNVNENTKRYINQKIGGLDKYVPSHAQKSLRGEVLLKRNKTGANKITCEVNLYLPKETINVKDSTDSEFAAIDIAENKLKNRLLKYKDTHGSVKFSRHLLNRFRKNTA